MTNVLVQKLSLRDQIPPEERKLLERIFVRVREVPADTDIVSEGQRVNESTLILEGLAARYKHIGEGRQITALHVAGDFVDLHSLLLKQLDHGVMALTPCTVAMAPHEALREITNQAPHLTRMLWLSTLIDASIHREWIVNMGRRTAIQRAASLICELYKRLEVVGKVQGMTFRLPLTQAELGDALGLSLVHVNRVIQSLRGQKLITWEGRQLTILDWEGLARLAEFDDAYLYLFPEPR